MIKLQITNYKLRIMSLLVLASFLIANLTGCAEVQRKFTRKKKAAVSKIPRYRAVKQYEKRPTQELYQRHYVFWRTWHSELLRVMGQNHKKDARCIGEIISNLKDMQNMLIPDKAARLGPHIAELEKAGAAIAGSDAASAYNTIYIRRILEKEDKAIAGGFKYKKVKDFIKTSFEDGV